MKVYGCDGETICGQIQSGKDEDGIFDDSHFKLAKYAFEWVGNQFQVLENKMYVS